MYSVSVKGFWSMAKYELKVNPTGLPLEAEYRLSVDRGPLSALDLEDFIDPYVTYPIRGYDRLRSISDLHLYSSDYTWQKHHARDGENDVTAEMVNVVVKRFTLAEFEAMNSVYGGLESHHVESWGRERHLVPADAHEVIAFGKSPAIRELKPPFKMAGLGSIVHDHGSRVVILDGDVRRVALLRCPEFATRVKLDTEFYGGLWTLDVGFLFVSE